MYSVICSRCQLCFATLQDLTRLKVTIPYLPHMCEDALKEKKSKQRSHAHVKRKTQASATSFDLEASVKMSEDSVDGGRKSSTGR